MRFDQLQQVWEDLGEQDPLWAVLTADKKKGKKWNVDDFFKTGEAFTERLRLRMSHQGLELTGKRALDFGCGVGRLTVALAPYFEEVIGLDISGPMVEQATTLCKAQNVRFVLNQADNLKQFDDDAFDHIQTFIVLQHMHPHHQMGYLREFARVLKPGGRLVFQVPGYAKRAIGPDDSDGFVSLEQLQAPTGAMRMFCCPPAQVLTVLDEAALELVAMERDQMTGEDYGSETYFCAKRSDPSPLYRAADGYVEELSKVVDRTQANLRQDPRYLNIDLWSILPPDHRTTQLQEALEESTQKLNDVMNSKAYRLGRRLADLAYRVSFRRPGPR